MRSRLLALLFLAGVTVSCFTVAIGCPTANACLNTGGPFGLSISPSVFSLWLVALSLSAWLVRTAWLMGVVSRAVDRLPRIASSSDLDEAVCRTGARRVYSVLAESRSAVCTGWVRPAVVVSKALLDQLRPDELDAVLLHEHCHAQRRDPLRRAILGAAADVYFFIPLVRWWAERQRATSELAADRLVIERLGRSALASALLSVDDDSSPAVAAAFAGATQLRVAQILGDPIQRPTPTASTWVGSIAGLVYGLTLAGCLLHLFIAG